MTEYIKEFERLLGHAALRLWPELPREVQEKLFETAVPLDPVVRNRLAILRRSIAQQIASRFRRSVGARKQ